MPAHTDFGLKIARIPVDWNRQVRRVNLSRRERQANVRHNKYFPVLLSSAPTGFVPRAVAQSEVQLRAGQDGQLLFRAPTNAWLIQLRRFPVLSKKQSRGEIRVVAKCGANVRV